jgi:dsDNA-specific endonuclease/ATPase MutS2
MLLLNKRGVMGLFNKSEKSKKREKTAKGLPPAPRRAPPFEGVDNSEVRKMLEKMHTMKKDLERKIEELYAKGKSNKLDVDALFGSKLSLTKQQLQQVNEYEQQLLQKIHGTLPPESCLKPAAKARSKEKLTQELRSKTRGARKKWMPVR